MIQSRKWLYFLLISVIPIMKSNNSLVETTYKISISDLKILGLTRSNSSRFLASTPCHFGGHRRWLVCPKCGRRTEALYFSTDTVTVVCRTCRGLKYECQSLSHKAFRFYKAMNHAVKADEQYLDVRHQYLYSGKLTYRAQRYIKHISLIPDAFQI